MHSNDDRGRWMRCNKWRHTNHPGQTREVNGRRTPRLAVGRQEAEEEGYSYQAEECVFDQICSFELYVIRYVMFLCFWVQFRTKQTKCFLAYMYMLNIIEERRGGEERRGEEGRGDERCFTWRNHRLPSPTRINLFLRP